MNAKKEKLPIESEVQPLKEEELDDVSGGAPSRHIEQIVARGEEKCRYCGGKFMSPGELKAHLKVCSKKPQ